MAHYVKLFGTILDSTVWETPPATRVVWITMLAMADRDGLVEASLPGLAKRAGVERGECERALALFSSPDEDSRTKEHGGRRIREVDGGWLLLNYEKYRDKATVEERLAKAAARQRRYQAREDAKRAAAIVFPDAASQKSDAPDVSDVADTLISPDLISPDLISEQPNARARDAGTSESFNSADLTALFSELRVAAGGGRFVTKRTDYDRLQSAVDWANGEAGDPREACRLSIAAFLRHATGRERDGWPLWGWANDPGKWRAYKPGNGNGKPGDPPPRDNHNPIAHAQAQRDLADDTKRTRERLLARGIDPDKIQ